jgi:gluconokinase
MQLYVLFGQPGSGKTFIGKVMQKDFGFFHYEADQDMPSELRDAIVAETVTDKLRDAFFNKIITRVTELVKEHEKIVVTQTFIKEKYRTQFHHAFPQAEFFYIHAPTLLREKRLLQRKEFQLPLETWRSMSLRFEDPTRTVQIIHNDEVGEGKIKERLQSLLI